MENSQVMENSQNTHQKKGVGRPRLTDEELLESAKDHREKVRQRRKNNYVPTGNKRGRPKTQSIEICMLN